MLRGTDYDWEHTTDLPDEDMVCGFCGIDVSSKTGFTGWLRLGGGRVRQDIYICHKCGGPNFFDLGDRQFPTYKSPSESFSETVSLVSPKFIKIYQQTQTAEGEGLDEIAGPGYGKALEFLVKDYLIKKLPREAMEIKSLSLHKCIHEKLENSKIKALADKAKTIRNDETHYERKYEGSDISYLKRLIHATCAWIDLESYTDEVAEDSTTGSDQNKTA